MPALAKIALAGSDDSWTRLAVMSSIKPSPLKGSQTTQALDVLETILKASEFKKLPAENQLPLLKDFSTLAATEPGGLKVAAAAQELGNAPLERALLTGFAEGLGRRGVRLDDYFKAVPNPNNPTLQWLREFFAQASQSAIDSKAALPERLACVRLVSHLSWREAGKTLAALLGDDVDQQIRLAAVRGLAGYAEPDVPALLLKGWRGYTPAVRREVTEAMFRNPARIRIMLGEIEAKRLRPGDIDAPRTRQLLKHPQPNLRALAEKLLKGNLPADRKEVLSRYREALTIKGDAKRGQEVFKKNCATCHRVNGIGIDVGPDIADSRTKTLEAFLVDILNPNQAIDNNYVNYLVTTKDGRTLTGIIAGETASSLLLKRAEGQTDTVLRTQIDEVQSTGISLMPEGLEKNITIPEMADLLSFLKNWRYIDGSVPIGN